MQLIPATKQHYLAITQLVRSPEELYSISPKASYPWDVAQLQALTETRSNFTIAEIDQQVVAYANLYQVTRGVSAFIGNVIVAEKYKGQGIGKRLTQHMMQLCKTEHQAQAHLSVFAFNTRALLMYKQLGFTPYDVEARKNLSGETVALLHMKA